MDEPWEYRELTDKEIDSCIEFSAEFYNKNDNADDPSAVVEQYAIDLFLTNMDRLGLILNKKNDIATHALRHIFGSEIEVFDGAGKALGIIFLHFDKSIEMEDFCKNHNTLIKVNLQ
jgi:hypothetical protein